MYRILLGLLFLGICLSLGAQQAAISNSQTAAVPSGKSASSASQPQPHTLFDGTPVKLRLSQTISSANAKVGQEISLEVVEEVKVDDVVVLPKGATAIASVTEANAKKSMGRAGKLNININYARLIDQEKVALRASQENKGGGHVGAMTGAIVATSIVFFPAAPLFLFIKGKDITIPQGTEITAFVEGDMHLEMSRFGVVPPPSAASAPLLQASVSIESTPAGADIEVDNDFVGTTPSTVNIGPGSHSITIKKKGFANWSRKMNVSGGSLHVNAELEAASAQLTVPARAPVIAKASMTGTAN